MDQAWALEESFWEASATGEATGWYARHMTTDGFVVLPNRILSRDDLVSGWAGKQSLDSYELSGPTFTLIEGGNVVISYEASMEVEWLPGYRAFVTALYTWLPGGWNLVCRTHTLRADFPF